MLVASEVLGERSRTRAKSGPHSQQLSEVDAQKTVEKQSVLLTHKRESAEHVAELKCRRAKLPGRVKRHLILVSNTERPCSRCGDARQRTAVDG